MLRKFTFLLFLLMVALTIQARHITGKVVDTDHRDLEGATVELLSIADSSVIRVTQTKEVQLWGWKQWVYELDVENNKSYLLRVSMLGYQTQYKKVDVKMADRANEQRVDDIVLAENARQLSEVVVKATKIKMVMKGDTVVYDASAFNLSEGSMLDALVQQMPGATLENGVIKVNGRTISSLLVDGRDFFNGDASKAMENLPAYTVDKIKVYDKAGRESRFQGVDMGDKELVLDVNLKKQYKHGNISNVDLALGSSDRYQARLFSMFYGKKSRLTLTGNVNNVNNYRVPGQDNVTGDLPDAGSGLSARKQFGLEYRYEGKTEDDYYKTSNSYTAVDNDNTSRTNAQTFLTGGDYYNLSTNANRPKNYTLYTRHVFSRMFKRSMLFGDVNASHAHSKGWNSSLSGRFNQKPWGMSALDSIFMPNADHALMQTVINRVRNAGKYQGESTSFSGYFNHSIKLGKGEDLWSQNNISLEANAHYNRSSNDRFALNRIDYLSTGAKDDRNQFSQSPNKSYDYSLTAEYTHFLINDSAGVRNFYVRPRYAYKQSYDSQTYDLYRLDQLADYDSLSYGMGVLPSTREALLSVKDGNNSYWSDQMTRTHDADVSFVFSSGDGVQRPRFMAYGNPGLSFKYDNLVYYRQRSYNTSRHDVLFQPNLGMMYQFNDSTGNVYASFNYRSSESQPGMTSMLDIRDDSNPLYVTLGNTNLKNARTHSVNAQWGKFHMRTQSMLSLGANYSITRNALATAVVYDKQTGVTTSQPRNINGNWQVGGNAFAQRVLDKKKHLTLQGNVYVNYNNSVDLTTVEGMDNTRSDVHNTTASGSVGLTYQLGEGLRLSLTPAVNYRHATSDRKDFSEVSAWNYNFRFSGMVHLPWSFELSSDLTSYNRRGYNDDQMNTSEWVWNARLTRGFLKKRLTLSLDAFDILAQLKNTDVTLNSQGRTETWRNSLPRYVMVHLSYKFNSGMAKPKPRYPWEN